MKSKWPNYTAASFFTSNDNVAYSLMFSMTHSIQQYSISIFFLQHQFENHFLIAFEILHVFLKLSKIFTPRCPIRKVTPKRPIGRIRPFRWKRPPRLSKSPPRFPQVLKTLDWLLRPKFISELARNYSFQFEFLVRKHTFYGASKTMSVRSAIPAWLIDVVGHHFNTISYL